MVRDVRVGCREHWVKTELSADDSAARLHDGAKIEAEERSVLRLSTVHFSHLQDRRTVAPCWTLPLNVDVLTGIQEELFGVDACEFDARRRVGRSLHAHTTGRV